MAGPPLDGVLDHLGMRLAPGRLVEHRAGDPVGDGRVPGIAAQQSPGDVGIGPDRQPTPWSSAAKQEPVD